MTYRLLNTLSLFLLLLSLTACGARYETTYRFKSPPAVAGKECAQECLNKMNACLVKAQEDEKMCIKQEREDSEQEYLRYVERQALQGKEIEKTRSNFAHTSHCYTDQERYCREMQRICHVNCGGDIIEERRCVAGCDRQ